MFELNPGLESQDGLYFPATGEASVFDDGQLRTLQRRVKRWRALEGPGQQVFFPQLYLPGELCESDFTHMEALAVTIAGSRFDHLV